MTTILRTLIPSKPRSSEGCWTCRLRRKKCDEHRPVCDNCAQLGIQCLYSEEKPAWMDNGARQAARAEAVKREVKEQARVRRERRHRTGVGEPDHDGEVGTKTATAKATGTSSIPGQRQLPEGIVAGPMNFSLPRNTKSAQLQHTEWDPTDHFATMEISSSSSSSPCSKGTPTSQTTQASECSMSPTPTAPAPAPAPALTSTEVPVMDDQSTYYVVIYLDYVFPYLFPHYRPKILEGGRGWLLALLNHNKALFHTAVSFSSYLFTAIYNLENPEAQPSTNHLWRQLQQRQALALQELQSSMSELTRKGIEGNLHEGARVLETILQLLVFDVSIGNMDHWALHLDAAVALFLQIVPTPDDWPTVISNLARNFNPAIPQNIHPMGPDMTAFRFFSGVLMYIDIMSSTVLPRLPRLQSYWGRLLPCTTSIVPLYSAPSPVHMESIIGCQNWMLKYIGEISSLNLWKQSQITSGTLNPSELLLRGQNIQTNISSAVELLAVEPPEQTENPAVPPLVMPIHQVGCPLGRRKAQAFGDFGGRTRDLIPLTTHIWASAALIYLDTVLYGWLPSRSEVKILVLQTLNMLEELPNPMFLQSVVWPFLVAGVMAPAELHSRFRLLEKNAGVIKVSETTRKAVSIMEELWKLGDLGDEMDIAKAFRILGAPFMAI